MTASELILSRGLYAVWASDLRAALDGRYGAFRWGQDIENMPGARPSPEMAEFVEEHAEAWLRVLDLGGGAVYPFARPYRLVTELSGGGRR